MARRLRTVLVCMLLALLGGSAAAERQSVGANMTRHALLIGIGHYPKPIVNLDGPVHDVDALGGRLIGDWGFDAANVVTLVDAEATRAAILSQLDRLNSTTRPGDYVFIYYSGHGTSAFDEDLRFEGTRLGKWTGALVPYDYATDAVPGPDFAKWTDQLIIGRRDLRPRLRTLDRERSVFVVFDTCFSGNSVRSISKRRVRWVSPVVPVRSQRNMSHLETPFEDDVIFGAATAQQDEYPYRRLIYLSAARKFERAEDIPSWETLDGRPHGAMTNALLKGLDGGADSDGDNRLTYDELYQFVQDEVSEKHLHMPQLLYPTTRPEDVQQPIFEHGQRSFAAVPIEAGSGELRVKLGHGLRHLRLKIEELPQVQVVEGDRYNVSLERQANGLVALYHPSGDHIAGGFDARSPMRLLARIARLAQAQTLIDFSYPRQNFTLSLEFSDGSGFLTADQRYDIIARSNPAAVLLLLNIDKSGTVSVLYPINSEELRHTSSLRQTFEVVPPYGTEYLKLFAFRSPPEELTRWIRRRIDALDPELDQLLRLLEDPRIDGAETRLKVVTVGRLVSDAGESSSLMEVAPTMSCPRRQASDVCLGVCASPTSKGTKQSLFFATDDEW